MLIKALKGSLGAGIWAGENPHSKLLCQDANKRNVFATLMFKENWL